MLGLRRKRSELSLTKNGDRAFESGQWKIAAQLYRRVLDRNPENASIWMKYGVSNSLGLVLRPGSGEGRRPVPNDNSLAARGN
jgi:hypothetical protein